MNKELLIEKAKAKGIEEIDIFEMNSSSNTINIYEQNVDNFKMSQSSGIAIRGLYNGKLGTCFLEEDDDSNIDFVIEQMINNANAITSKDKVEIYAGDTDYPVIERTENVFKQMDTSKKIEFLKELELKIKNKDPRISQVMLTELEEVSASASIVNSKGCNISRSDEGSFLVVEVLAKENDDNKCAYHIESLYDLNTFDEDKFIHTLIDKAVSKLNATQIPSDIYPVIIKNETLADILAALSGIFNGESAFKGISILKDKVNEKIFDERITITDNPLLKDGYNSTPFDDEGVASFIKNVVENGVLKTYLHNLKSAHMMNCKTTGNGFKSGYASGVGIHPTNLFIQPSDKSYDDLVKGMKKGVIIDNVQGLHAGLNPITTDFSLQSSGYYVEDGKIVKPINLITVAGNFIKMMNEIDEIGNDLEFNLSGIGTPSIRFKGLNISGE